MAYGQQSIGCEVHSCLFHQQGNTCRLNSITVRPTPGCTTWRTGRELLRLLCAPQRFLTEKPRHSAAGALFCPAAQASDAA